MTNPLDIEHTTSCGHTWTMRHTACPDCFAEMRQRAVAAETEVERLRGALEQIDAEAGCPAAEYVPALPRIWEIARAALRGGVE